MSDTVLHLCASCRGLLPSSETLIAHQLKCDGSTCEEVQLYACDRRKYELINQYVQTEEPQSVRQEEGDGQGRDTTAVNDSMNQNTKNSVDSEYLVQDYAEQTQCDDSVVDDHRDTDRPNFKKRKIHFSDDKLSQISDETNSMDHKTDISAGNSSKSCSAILSYSFSNDNLVPIRDDLIDMRPAVICDNKIQGVNICDHVSHKGTHIKRDMVIDNQSQSICSSNESEMEVKVIFIDSNRSDSENERFLNARYIENGQESLKCENPVSNNSDNRKPDTHEKQLNIDDEMGHQKIRWVTKDKVSFPCGACSHVSSSMAHYKRHMQTAHASAWGCPHCGESFSSKAKLTRHVYKHTRPFVCAVCEKGFSQKIDLDRHVTIHNDEFEYACRVCDYKCRTKNSLVAHERKHQGVSLKCPHCEYTTPHAWALKSHVMCKHQEAERFVCEACGYRTNNTTSFSNHMKRHAGTKQFKCAECDYLGITRHQVIRHMRKHSQEKSYFCNQCGFATAYGYALRRHMVSHLGQKPWQCSACDYGNGNKAKVIEHIAAKHGGDPTAQPNNTGTRLEMNLADFRTPPNAPPVEVYSDVAVEMDQYIVVGTLQTEAYEECVEENEGPGCAVTDCDSNVGASTQ